MHLKRLTVQGFKSFADKTEFEFESVLTGVVGPNGCGKSNVVDALKWVLGDQRARSLRGKEMTDVIFKGAEGRGASHTAQVSLLLEDDEGRLGGQTEVSISRRLNMEKESEYLINGDKVRLKDVRDLLMNTGLGVGAYSVMEQGRIDAVLSANPENRRAIFEEAAGISRFKLQKRETLRRLDHTEQNLARVKDLLEERGRRIRSLKVQAGKARRYKILRAELRDLRAALAVVEGRELQVKHEARASELAKVQEELQTLQEQQEQEQVQLQQLDAKIQQRNQELAAVQEDLHSRQSQLSTAEQRKQSQEHRAQELQQDAAKSAQHKQELEAQHADKIQALQDARQKLVDLEQELVVLGTELEQRQSQLQEQQTKVRELQAHREQARERILELMHQRTRARNSAHDQEAQMRALGTRDQRLLERLGLLDLEADQTEAQGHALAGKLSALQRQELSLASEERMALQELEEADQKAAELLREESQQRQQLSSAQGRMQVLEDMEAHWEGLDQGPRWLLENKPEGLKGRLLDLLQVDLAHSPALEAALGPYVQGLVVESRAHADAMLALLQENKAGRALLLVESEFDSGVCDRSLLALPDGSRPLKEVVQAPAGAKGLVDWLLRGVVLVQDLSQADCHRQDLCFVTPDGGLVCGPRVEGGSKEGEGGLIVRRAKLQVLEQETTILQAELQKLLAGKEEVESQVLSLKQETRQLSMSLQNLRADMQGKVGARDRCLDRSSVLFHELSTLQQELAELQGQRLQAQAQLMTHLMNVHLVSRNEASETAVEAAAAADLAQVQAAATTANAAEQDVQLRLVRCRGDREGARDAGKMLEQALAELRTSTQSLQEREDQARQNAADAQQQAASCQAQMQELQQQCAELQGKRQQAQDAVTSARTDLDGHRQASAEMQKQQAALSENLHNGRLALNELEHRLARLEERLSDDVGVELRRCLGQVEGYGKVLDQIIGPRPMSDSVDSSDMTVLQLLGPAIPESQLQDQMQLQPLWQEPDFNLESSRHDAKVVQAKVDRLGTVNLEAVEELEDEESNYVDTERQVDDLAQSRTSLVEALRRMEQESRAMFEETFEAARSNFQTIFRKLFQGGKADMYLQDDVDALDCGIEIMARPPGKELQSINLLSGGERTLTALAILFAVFKVKPSPFCILDEVDAALDDTNVERFLRVLNDFVGPTQFCVVTHHKRTMAACKQLYGVTMQRRGVSSRIAVSLEQVDELTETGLKGQHHLEEKQRVAGEEAVGF